MDIAERGFAPHRVRVFESLIPGVYSTSIRSGFQFGKHWHDVYGFGLLQDGAQSWASGRGQVAAYPGQVISTNPGEVHDGKPLGAATRDWRIVSVEVGTMASFVGLPSGGFEIARPVVEDHALAFLVERLFIALDDGGDIGAHRLACEEAFTRACMYLIAWHGSRPVRLSTPPANLHRVRDRLADDAQRTPTLDELAQIAGLSRYQVLRRFEKQFGLPPHAWLLHYRAEWARALIRSGKSLATAAGISGFADQSHMTRTFVRQYGYTPGAWKSAVQQH